MRKAPSKAKELTVGESLSLNHQLGVIANRLYKKGELLFAVEGPIKPKRSRYSFAVGLNRHIEPKKEKNGAYNLGHYVNHSCDPTVITRIIRKSAGKPYIEIIARRDIKKGEEIAFDYATLEHEITFPNTVCRCNTSKCRGIVQGFKDLPKNIFKKYKKEGIIADYLLQLREKTK